MHILLIHQFFLKEGEGGGTRWNEFTRIWRKAGHEITVLAGDRHYLSSEAGTAATAFVRKERNRDGVTIFRCYTPAGYNKDFWRRGWGYLAFLGSGFWAGLRYTRAVDLVIATSPPLLAGIPAWLLSRWKRVPLVFEIRDLWPRSAIELGIVSHPVLIQLARGLEKQLYKRAALLVVLTPAFRQLLIQEQKIPHKKILYIPNSADFGLVSLAGRHFNAVAFRKSLNLHDRFVICYAGAHGVANHLEQVLDAAELLRDTRAVFLLIGDGMQKPSLIRSADRRKLSNVLFIDPVPKPAIFRYILASDAGLAVLKKAAIFKTVYSNKTFDYFACKKPVFVAIDGISRSLIQDADAGAYIIPEAPDDFADKVNHYLSRPELARLQGLNGYRLARNYFDRERLAFRYLANLEKLLPAFR